MGNGSSKKSLKHQRVHNGRLAKSLSSIYDEVKVDYVSKLDRQTIDTIKKDLSENPELFVLNNMLMAVMFFENYKKDIEELSLKRREREEDCIEPDVILDRVAENVRYLPLHGEKKPYSEPLLTKRMFVLNDIFEVVSSTETVEHVGKSTVRMEESHRIGFVKLKELETTYTPCDSPIFGSQSEASTSRSSTDSESYDYPAFTDHRTPKPIDIFLGLERNNDKRGTLPRSCVTYRKIRKIALDLELEEQYIEQLSQNDLYEITSYISSKGFMKYFQNNIFPMSVAEKLGFNLDDIYGSSTIPGKIFCNLRDTERVTPCEVIPCIPIRWPREQTLDFIMKANKIPGVRKRYIFPTQTMLKEIQTLDCVLVPKGYYKKKGEHIDCDIEWELYFPQAERYLETYMSHAQMKSFLLLITLHKTYIEPRTLQLGLLTEHIRSFMLWECEANYSDWPEHRLGTKLISVIKNLSAHLAKGSLQDYFIKEKNAFSNIPKKYLRHAQKVLHDVLESPVMHFIRSLRNLRYTKGNYFYEPLDYEELYKILKKNGLESTNPQIITKPLAASNKRRNYNDRDTQWQHFNEIRKREKILSKRRENDKVKENNLYNVTEEKRRGSVDSIDLDWTCDKQFDIHKTRAILRFFIDVFIDIAKKSYQISSEKQTLFYLKQAKYLVKILEDECPAFTDEVQEFLSEINRHEENWNFPLEQKTSTASMNMPNGSIGSNTEIEIVENGVGGQRFAETNRMLQRKSLGVIEIHRSAGNVS